MVDTHPFTTIGELKRQLKRICKDEVMRKMTSVDLVKDKAKLMNNHATVVEAGLSPDVVLQVCFTVTH